MNDEYMVMEIEEPFFEEMRASFNAILNSVFKKMHTRDANKGEINLKLTIKLEDKEDMDCNTGVIIHIKQPDVDYSITHKLDYAKAQSIEGKLSKANSQLLLKDGAWMIRSVSDGQQTLRDYLKNEKADE